MANKTVFITSTVATTFTIPSDFDSLVSIECIGAGGGGRSPNTAANGYTYLTNGILMQWGWVLANTSTGNATFPVAFPSTCYTVQTCSVNALTTETTRTATYLTAAANTTVAIIRTANATVATNVGYLAVGV